MALPLYAGVAGAQTPTKAPEVGRPIAHVAPQKSCAVERAGVNPGHCIVKHRRPVRSQKEHAAHAAS